MMQKVLHYYIWNYMYKERTLHIWRSYGIFNKSAYEARTTHGNFEIPFTNVSSDHYLKSNEKVTFISII